MKPEKKLENAIDRGDLKEFTKALATAGKNIDLNHYYNSSGYNLLHSAILKKQTFILEKEKLEAQRDDSKSLNIQELDHLIAQVDLIIDELIKRMNINLQEKLLVIEFSILTPKDELICAPSACTPLHFAIEVDDLLTFNKLLEKDADISITNSYKEPAICTAARKENLNYLKLIVAHAKRKQQPLIKGLEPEDNPTYTALRQCKLNKIAFIPHIDFLLEQLDLNHPSFSGLIQQAIHHKLDDFAKKFFAKGVRYDLDREKRTPYFTALKHNNKELMNLFIQTELKFIDPLTHETVLHRAVANGSAKFISVLLKINGIKNVVNGQKIDDFDVNAKTSNESKSQTALHHAVLINENSLIKEHDKAESLVEELLKEKKIAIDEQDSEGLTALAHAVKKEQLLCVQILLRAGAKLTPPPDTTNLLHFAVDHNRANVISILVQNDDSINTHGNKSIDINEVDKNGYSPLHRAVIRSHLDCVKTLITLGANLFLQDKKGNTFFHIACLKKNKSVINLIINSLNPEKIKELLKITNKDGKSLEDLLRQETIKDVELKQTISQFIPPKEYVPLPMALFTKPSTSAVGPEKKSSVSDKSESIVSDKKGPASLAFTFKDKNKMRNDFNSLANAVFSSSYESDQEEDEKAEDEKAEQTPVPIENLNKTVISSLQTPAVTFMYHHDTRRQPLKKRNKLTLQELAEMLASYKPNKAWKVGDQDLTLVVIPGSKWKLKAHSFHEIQDEIKDFYMEMLKHKRKEMAEKFIEKAHDGIYFVGSTSIQVLIGQEVVTANDRDIMIVNDYIDIGDVIRWARSKKYLVEKRGKRDACSAEIYFPENKYKPLSIICIKSENMKSNLFNRDYTINAIALQFFGKYTEALNEKVCVISVWEWLKDLLEAILRTIDLPKESFSKDWSRKLRGIILKTSKVSALEFKWDIETKKALNNIVEHEQKPNKLIYHLEKLILIHGFKKTVAILNKYNLFSELKFKKDEIEIVLNDKRHFPENLQEKQIKTLVASFKNNPKITDWQNKNEAALQKIVEGYSNENNNSDVRSRFLACMLMAALNMQTLFKFEPENNNENTNVIQGP